MTIQPTRIWLWLLSTVVSNTAVEVLAIAPEDEGEEEIQQEQQQQQKPPPQEEEEEEEEDGTQHDDNEDHEEGAQGSNEEQEEEQEEVVAGEGEEVQEQQEGSWQEEQSKEDERERSVQGSEDEKVDEGKHVESSADAADIPNSTATDTTTTTTTGTTTSTSSEEDSQQKTTSSKSSSSSKPRELLEDSGFDASNRNWGTYYDPQNIFCGKYDCYKILGFDYDMFGKNPPDSKIITKRYRKLSREWHPDKSKHVDAKERFVKIARAYEVLTDKTLRQEYDALRFDPGAYFKKYGTSILWSYAPQSDLSLVLLCLFVLANLFSWWLQKHRWQRVADRLTKAAVEDWTTAHGGSPESKRLRKEALTILYDGDINGNKNKIEKITNGTKAEADKGIANNSTGKKQKGAKKLSGREKKKIEEEALLPIVKALVQEIKDFGGGFHQPTWRDLLAVSMVRWPWQMAVATLWNVKYYLRRWQKVDLSDDEIQVLTQRAVGSVIWDTSSDDQRLELMGKKLWIQNNYAQWVKERQQAQQQDDGTDGIAGRMKKGKVE